MISPSYDELHDRVTEDAKLLELMAENERLRIALDESVAREAAMLEAIKQINRANWHSGSGPHCTCSQQERESIANQFTSCFANPNPSAKSLLRDREIADAVREYWKSPSEAALWRLRRLIYPIDSGSVATPDVVADGDGNPK